MIARNMFSRSEHPPSLTATYGTPEPSSLSTASSKELEPSGASHPISSTGMQLPPAPSIHRSRLSSPNPGSESQNATYFAFSLNCVFHLYATERMHASEQTTGTWSISVSARTLAWHPSPRALESLYPLRDRTNPRILPDRSGPPATRMTSNV